MKLTEIKSSIDNKSKRIKAAFKKITLGQWIIIALLFLIFWQLIGAPVIKIRFVGKTIEYEKLKGECISKYYYANCDVSFYTRPSIFIMISSSQKGKIFYTKRIYLPGKTMFPDGTAFCFDTYKNNSISECRYNGKIYKYIDINSKN